MFGSLQEGIRKYQGPQTAQTLAALYAEGGANRERFRAISSISQPSGSSSSKSWIAKRSAAAER